jgi:YegS/Rv2252/BmrU family lipid kinase
LPDRVFVLFNPSAGRGRCAQRIGFFLELLERHVPGFHHAVTARAGDEDAVLDRALADGYDTIVAAGGDGTWSRAADRIVRSGRAGVALGLLAGGTGNDFGKSVGVTFERSEDSVKAIAAGRRTRIDVGKVHDRHFLNVVGFGFDIAVIDDAASTPLLKGDLLYRFCAAKQLFRFPGLPLEISAGGDEPERIDHLMLIVANARVFGGSFRIAPEADLRDGRLDLVSIGNAGPFRRAKLFDLVARGRHAGEPEVEMRRSPAFRVGFRPPLRYEVDGEVCATSAEELLVVSVPGALDLLAPGGI